MTHQPGGVFFWLVFFSPDHHLFTPTVSTSNCDTGLWLASRTTPSWPQPSCRAMCTWGLKPSSRLRHWISLAADHKTPNQKSGVENASHQTPTSHQNSSIFAHRASDRVDFPSCRTYQHLLPSCPKTVGLSHRPKPPTASRHNSMGKTTRNCWMKRLCELFMCSTYETAKRLSINHYVKPTKRVMFLQSPQNFGKHFPSQTRSDSNHSPEPVLQVLRHVRHQESRTPRNCDCPYGVHPCADHRSDKSDKDTGVVKPCKAGTILRCFCFRNNTQVLDTNTNNLED